MFWPYSFSPDQEPVYELLLLLYVSSPVSLDVSVELIFQRVTVIFRIQFTNLKKQKKQKTNHISSKCYKVHRKSHTGSVLFLSWTVKPYAAPHPRDKVISLMQNYRKTTNQPSIRLGVRSQLELPHPFFVKTQSSHPEIIKAQL